PASTRKPSSSPSTPATSPQPTAPPRPPLSTSCNPAGAKRAPPSTARSSSRPSCPFCLNSWAATKIACRPHPPQFSAKSTAASHNSPPTNPSISSRSIASSSTKASPSGTTPLSRSAPSTVHPRAAALYGEHLGRLLAAARGRSAKCLVLDLDNTLWSGVIGDDGLEGIVLGQGSEIGEAHLELQRYALSLTERGIILAVCSKNDEANALAPFISHPEMILKREHIACFVANWTDKATNLRSIAKQLNIGLDALVFVDDNPAERAIVRQEIPAV